MKLIKINKLNESQKEYLIERVNGDKDRFFVQMPINNTYTIMENGNIIPAFINIKDNLPNILWVDKEFRRKGYGTFLVNKFNVKYVQVHSHSIPFWKSLGFRIISERGVPIMIKEIK